MLQDLLAGVRDRVVIAVTFLAMLELMKRREIVVEQAEPWGPIVARATTRRGARRGRRGRGASRRAARRVAGVVRVTERRRDRGRVETAEPAEAARPTRRRAAGSAPIELTEAALEALLFVAERPLSRREIAALAGVDRETVDARLGDLEVSLRGRGIRAAASTATGSSSRRRPRAARSSPATSAPTRSGCRRRRSRRWRSSPIASRSRRPPSSASAASTRTTRSATLLHRRLVVELGRSSAPGRPFLYGTGFEFLERFGLTSLDELPPLDADVAARLAEEGGEPPTDAASSRRCRDRATGADGAATGDAD